MLGIGDVHVYVSDFTLAMRFWRDGLGLEVIEHEIGASGGFAILAFPAGDVRLRLFTDAGSSNGSIPPPRRGVSFDVLTDSFDEVLIRLLEHGGEQLDAVESYDDLRVVSISDSEGNRFELVEAPPIEHSENG